MAIPDKAGITLANKGIKKWFMLQIWRIQQVAQIVTIAMLSLTLATQLYPFFQHRGGIWETPYTGIPPIILAIALVIWAISIFWDLRLKMWRDQATVLVERNPYSKEKMSSKEILLYAITWLPIMDRMGKDDPNIKAAADAFRLWIRKISKDDLILQSDFKDLQKMLDLPKELVDFEKKELQINDRP